MTIGIFGTEVLVGATVGIDAVNGFDAIAVDVVIANDVECVEHVNNCIKTIVIVQLQYDYHFT